MRTLVSITWAVALLLEQSALAQKQHVSTDQSDKRGELTIHFVTSLGTPIVAPNEVILVVDDARSGRMITKQQGNRPLNLPYGSYWLRAQYSGAYPVDKKIVIRDRFQVSFISFTVAPVELPWDGNTVRGVITDEHAERGGCRWVRLIPAFTEGDVYEAKASLEGRFVVENVRPGLYLGIVSGNDGLCSVTTLTIFEKPLQELELKSSN